MPSKKELQADLVLADDSVDYLLKKISLTETNLERITQQKHVLEGKYNRLQQTVIELNRRNNRLRDHIIKNIENG